jgi:hypothetical protein
MSLDKDNRPTFLYNNDPELEIRAGGAIFYKIDKNSTVQFLMLNSRGKYEDFGGKTDIKDKTINHTIAREVDEESNHIFIKKNILKRINNLTPCYTRKSKYQIYFIKLTETESLLDVSIFGDKEIHDNIPRTVEYISIDNLRDTQFIKNNLCFRLKFKAFFKFVDEIYNKYNKSEEEVESDEYVIITKKRIKNNL